MQNEILPLTSLRFIAALYLFLFHIQLYFPIFKHDSIARLLTELVSKYPILANNGILAFIAFLLLITISTISHHFTEVKFRNYLNKKYTEYKTLEPTIKLLQHANF